MSLFLILFSVLGFRLDCVTLMETPYKIKKSYSKFELI